MFGLQEKFEENSSVLLCVEWKKVQLNRPFTVRKENKYYKNIKRFPIYIFSPEQTAITI